MGPHASCTLFRLLISDTRVENGKVIGGQEFRLM